METQNIATQQVGYVQPVSVQTQTNPIESAKKPEMKEDGEKKLWGALACLGAAAMGSLALYDLSRGDSSKLKKLFKKAPKTIETGHTPKAQKVQQAVEEGTKKAQNAINELSEGANYKKIRMEGKKNLPKAGKKVFQEELSEAHSKKVAAQIATEHANSANVVKTIDATKEIKKANQGIHSAVSSEEISARMEAAKKASETAQKAADEVKIISLENPTHQNTKRATFAQNQANEAQRMAKRVEENGLAEQMAMGREAAAKQRNIEQMTASPNYQAGLEKQAQNAQKSSQRKVNRDLAKITSKPEYQRTLQNMQRQRFTGEKLMQIMDNPQKSVYERLAAQELLEKMTK
ncbi:MAG: hypothetical protein IJB79_08435 [Candidatus Gastranaerophilales bacterium]|nr:hypothetical protein [Candidatus Gastranaerophilales bacterium]